ncbi:MAG TPA: hypothetical protein VLS94_00655, partial [Fusibacter sp.]|nr:hypothetical protein [Fusibacter sp.]
MPSAAGRAKQRLLFLETGASRRADCFGSAFQWPVKHAGLSAIFGARIARWLPKETHSSVGKETGQTCRVERWNNTCRQSNAR